MVKLFKPEPPATRGWRNRSFHIVFGHATIAGRAFDILLIAVIFFSVLVAMLDSVNELHARHGMLFYGLEWAFTLLFTAEYVLRLAIVRHPLRYARSFYGVIDILSVLPTYVALAIPGMQFLIVVRILRILRIFEILHMKQYVYESAILVDALVGSGRKILVFLLSILTIVTVFGAVMYLVEGEVNGFTSIPTSIYWAIVTVGTVGYGDIAPATPLGRVITAVLILIGYGIIAVPTGIYTAELIASLRQPRDNRECRQCGLRGHDSDAAHCRRCGLLLQSPDDLSSRP